MPITTRTIAKGIPPRVHQPKQSHKGKKAKKDTRATTKSSRKRVATSESDESESESEPMRKKGAKSRRLERQDEETEEEEMVSEHAREPPELIDDVDNGATPPSSDEQDVRTRTSIHESQTLTIS
jgi:hypothetical protein